ncbi:MAG: hypothetical protein HQ503_04295 [Rhodospirillales bacterium]|nr:hypothetical protein [Rhodospirillales bacterium]
MNENMNPIPEVVGTVAGKAALEEILAALRVAGFEDTDISLLSSHDSLSALSAEDDHWVATLTALAGEYKVLGPLAVSGGVILAGGPAIGAIAALIGAAVGGMALIEVVREVFSETDADDIARALEAGSVILWVQAEAKERQDAALSILEEHGALQLRVTGRGVN